MCLEFADKIFIFGVLERKLLQLRETDSSFVFIINEYARHCNTGDDLTPGPADYATHNIPITVSLVIYL